MVMRVLLLTYSSLRLYELIRSVKWVWEHGRSFGQARRELGDAISNEERYELYATQGGLFFPFGVKGLRLEVWQRRLRLGRLGRTRSALVQILRWAWAFYLACPVVLILCLFAGFRHPTTLSVEMIVAAQMLAGVLTLLVEAVVANVRIGGWGHAYHGLGEESTSAGELSAAAGVGILLLSCVMTLFFLVARQEPGGLGKIPEGAPIEMLGNSAYYAAFSMLQFSDAGPVGALAKVATLFAVIAGALYFLCVVAIAIGKASTLYSQSSPGNVKGKLASDRGRAKKNAGRGR